MVSHLKDIDCLKDYDLPASGDPALGYIVSEVLGILVAAIATWLFAATLTAGIRQPRIGKSEFELIPVTAQGVATGLRMAPPVGTGPLVVASYHW